MESARSNGEVIQIADSQMVRTIFQITGRKFSLVEYSELLDKRKMLSRRRSKSKNVPSEMAIVQEKIAAYKFIHEIVNVEFDDSRHYTKILDKKGFLLNGVKYVPFMSSAGQIRRSSSLFIDERLKPEITEIFNNSRDMYVEIVPAKFSAYYALYSSSSFPVSFPRLAVVPDLTIKTNRLVNFSTFVDDKSDPLIEEKTVQLECNAFDGSGIMTPSYARRVMMDLEISYMPSAMIIRAPFMKGLVATFDIKKFAYDVAGKNTFTDVYGKIVNVDDVDVIVTESMFKMWQSYPSTESYVNSCEEYNLDFCVSKVNPEVDKTHCKTSYQFLQVLDADDEAIEKLCAPTMDWLKDVSGYSIEKTLLYSLGDIRFEKGWFSRLDSMMQALLLENSLKDDDYFYSHFSSSILKKKNDAKMGRLLFEGNYSFIIPDLYLHACHIFGMELQPLLKEGEHYSQFWNERGVSRVAGIRSPIVHESEVDVLNFRNDEDVGKWFGYIKSGIIFPANGIGMDFVILGGAD